LKLRILEYKAGCSWSQERNDDESARFRFFNASPKALI